MKQLQKLSVDNVDAITEKGITYLTAIPGLNDLSLSDLYKLRGDVLKTVAQIKHLTVLHMDNDFVASGLPYLVDTKIKWLSLSGCDPKPQELLALTKIRSLKTLRLDKDNVDGKTVLALANLPNLKELSVKHSALSQSVIDKFHKLNPHCDLVYDKELVDTAGTK